MWFQDEARFGLKGTLSTVWGRRGTRPTAVRQHRYDWTYLFSALCPATGESVSMIAPRVDAGMMNLHLSWISDHVKKTPAGDLVRVLLVLDGAGWHKSAELVVPDNITLVFLPPYAPELNPVERLWLALRNRTLSNRAFASIQDLEASAAAALRALTPRDLRSICAAPWLEGD